MAALTIFFLMWPVAGPAPAPAQVRAAVERGLPPLMAAGLKWKARTFTAKKIQCVSCHHVPLAVWTHNEARAAGFAVDQAKIDTLTEWMVGFSTEKKYPDELVDGFLDTVLLAGEKGVKPARHVKAFETFQHLLSEQQRTDGSWKRQDGKNEPGFAILRPGTGGQPAAAREAQEVDTMWALLGLNALGRLGDSLSTPARASLEKQRAAGVAFLKDAKESSRADWLAFRMMLDRDAGDQTKVSHWRKTLLGRQNPDGGWGLGRGDPSHPAVTGQALYALGADADERAVRRAWGYLLAAQTADGAWPAPSRVLEDHQNDVTDNFAAGWATLGLLKTLPPKADAGRTSR